MAIFCDLPIMDNEKIDVYAILRTQYLSACKKKHQIQQRLANMIDPGQIRFYKKRVKYTPKGCDEPRIYEYNQHYLRFDKVIKDENGHNKTHHITRFLTNKEYEDTKRESVLYRYLSESLKYIIDLIDSTRKFILSSFYYHPDNIPDLFEEELNTVQELERATECRQWHATQRASYSQEKYKCMDSFDTGFMSRGELLLHDAFIQCGLTPQYETKLELDDITASDDLEYEFGSVKLPSKVYYPDFKCSCGGKTYYFEYFGMMNDPVYFKDACKKIEVYLRNGIVPGHNFIAFCSGDYSAIRMKPVFRTLKHIVSGRNLLQKNNISKMPGIIKLDNINNWKLPLELTKAIKYESSKYISQKHKFKSSIKAFANNILKKDSI